MLQFLLGLSLFFAIHSISIVAMPLRDKLAQKNEMLWKMFYAFISLVGVILLIRGYADLKQLPTILYVSPIWLRHVAATLLIPTFILFLAPYFPGRISHAIKHPQLIAVKIWAFSHLLVNGALADVLLFGSFLIWAVIDRRSLNNRVSRAVPSMPQSRLNDLMLVVVGFALYVAMVFALHELLIGVRPFI